jgi:hypothetical protein
VRREQLEKFIGAPRRMTDRQDHGSAASSA